MNTQFTEEEIQILLVSVIKLPNPFIIKEIKPMKNKKKTNKIKTKKYSCKSWKIFQKQVDFTSKK